MPSAAIACALDNWQAAPLALGSDIPVYFGAWASSNPSPPLTHCAFLTGLGNVFLIFSAFPAVRWGQSLPQPCTERGYGICQQTLSSHGPCILTWVRYRGMGRISGLGRARSDVESQLYWFQFYQHLIVTLGKSLDWAPSGPTFLTTPGGHCGD